MLFISHKTCDKCIAEEVLRRGLAKGYSEKQMFLDSDPGAGIDAGTAWEEQLYERLKHSRAMIVLCSEEWLTSQWCFVELGYARAMAISIFPILIEKCDVGSTLNSIQGIDLSTKNGDCLSGDSRDLAFERLWNALEERRLGPKHHIPWPSNVCPFPGLMSFEEKHAAVFFGRESERDAIIKQLESMRSSGVPRFLIIVGGSGSGKSSLLRAGVLPWLRHSTERDDWLILPTLRFRETSNDDLTLLAQLAGFIASSYKNEEEKRPEWTELRAKFESNNFEEATRHFVDAIFGLCLRHQREGTPSNSALAQTPTALLPIDQFEELLSAADTPSAKHFLKFMKCLLSRSNGKLLVISTMRSDYLDTFEQRPEFIKAPFLELYRLPPFPWDRITDVIVKPAERVNLEFTSELISRLKKDAPDSDALPLLAFTLEKLYRQFVSRKVIELREYEELGGMTGAISQAVSRILSDNLPSETELALRRTFVNHLADVNEKDEVIRRRGQWNVLPVAARPLLTRFIEDERLLQRSGEKGEFVEVTHEALFRCWDKLRSWLKRDLPGLRLRRRVGALSAEWHTTHDSGLLLTPAQLDALDEWVTQGGITLHGDELLYVNASRDKRKIHDKMEVERLREVADAQRAKAQQAYLFSIGIAIVALVAILMGTWAGHSRNVAYRQLAINALSEASSLEWRASDKKQHSYLLAMEKLKDSGQTTFTLPRSTGATIYSGCRNLIAAWGQLQDAYICDDDPFVGVWFTSESATGMALTRGGSVLSINDAAAEDCIAALPISSPVTASAFDGASTLITGHRNGTILAWSTLTWTLIGNFERASPDTTKAEIRFIACVHGSDTFIAAPGDAGLEEWNVKSKTLLARFGEDQAYQQLAISRDGHTVVATTGIGECSVSFWMRPDTSASFAGRGTRLQVPRRTSALAFTPTGLLVTGSGSGGVRLWDVSADKQIGVTLSHGESPVTALAVSSDGTTIASGGENWRLKRWNSATHQQLDDEWYVHNDDVTCVDISKDGQITIAGCKNGFAGKRTWSDVRLKERLGVADKSISGSCDILGG